jgi:hypothetical protein
MVGLQQGYRIWTAARRGRFFSRRSGLVLLAVVVLEAVLGMVIPLAGRKATWLLIHQLVGCPNVGWGQIGFCKKGPRDAWATSPPAVQSAINAATGAAHRFCPCWKATLHPQYRRWISAFCGSDAFALQKHLR